MDVLSVLITFLSICVKQYQAMYPYKVIFYIRKEKMSKENLLWTEYNTAAKVSCSSESI